ncbi:hypothetical protein [Armatimonas sp.]|uniref:hypothetical protein n=1 Tax=Armatimonas sp. TaxID=1872638 RepID=UPI00286C1DD0|nr:hypothetical protein [Armatimonas sp.]
MQLYPQDLSDNDHARLIQKRALTSSGSAAAYDPNAPLPEPKLGKLGRLWSKGLGMTDRQAAVGNANASSWTLATGWCTAIFGPFLPGLIVLIMARKHGLDPNIAWASFGAATAGFSAMGFGPFAKAAFRSLHKPLQVTEIEGLIKDTADELDRAYLALLRDVLLTDVPEKAEADIRAAVAALGEAIERLPSVMTEPVDTTLLRAEAAQLAQQALTEPDRVTADSISRRADALERRAQAHEKSALLSKRATALRAEIQAQIETLREGLVGHQLEDGVGPTVAFAELSDTARRVAQEAAAAAEARQELAQVQTR